MAARTFTMPGSLDESLAKLQPPNGETGRDQAQKAKEAKDSFYPAQRAPLAYHGVKYEPGITFSAQDKLAKLPIPELGSTLQKYMNVLEPLQTKKEQNDTYKAVEDFKKGEGPELQARLKKYATGKTSYIEQFCEQLIVAKTMLSLLTLDQGMIRT